MLRFRDTVATFTIVPQSRLSVRIPDWFFLGIRPCPLLEKTHASTIRHSNNPQVMERDIQGPVAPGEKITVEGTPETVFLPFQSPECHPPDNMKKTSMSVLQFLHELFAVRFA